MTILRSFKAVKPRIGYEKDVAAFPYDVLNSKEAREMVKGNPYSFLHVDKAEIDLPEDVDVYDKKVYKKAKENLDNMIEKEVLVRDKKAKLYIYRLQMGNIIQTGIVGCASIDDYMNDVIKKHEHTREEKEIDRINHVDTCNAHTGPIFLTYKYDKEVDNIIKKCTLENPVYNFMADDNIIHTVWEIKEDEIIKRLENLFKNIPNVYIADGHHRTASAVKVGLKRREENKNYTGEEEFNYFLAVFFPADELKIMDYNRVVFDTLDLTEEEFMKAVEEKFDVDLYEKDEPYKPEKNHYFGMYYNNKWYKLKAKEGTYDEKDPVANLDVSILQENLLTPILKIKDVRKDKRIDFVGGIRGLKELQKRINKTENGVAFSMYPTAIEELMNIADIDKVMPPKSTWFEPKLRSGLFIHEI
ncbi:DUF1015 domain-containing protein [Clostridium oceanicum]|uniref:DUF1015 family protein n=1 Tax=Clostridium oceanicum TaxID=1543 RepID=A0ABN1JEW1_9CLOT